jgi:hypothetical protein
MGAVLPKICRKKSLHAFLLMWLIKQNSFWHTLDARKEIIMKNGKRTEQTQEKYI